MDTRTKMTVALLAVAAFSSTTATAIHSSDVNQTSATEFVVTQKYCGTKTFSAQDDIKFERRKKSYRERYRRIGGSNWFGQHYKNKSLGEVAEIVD